MVEEQDSAVSSVAGNAPRFPDAVEPVVVEDQMSSNASLSPPAKWISRADREKPHSTRSEFERDRDRILYSRPFRRLSGKTQVFLSRSHDHVRTRLTHTLEVAQIARTAARQLGLDETFAEAIALGHDLGHTPFGHVGERTLNLVVNGCYEVAPFQQRLRLEDKGFKHNLQSVRVTCRLTQLYSDVRHGLDLTNFTLWGIANHSSTSWTKRDVQGAKRPCSHYAKGICQLTHEARACPNDAELRTDFYAQDHTYLTIGDEGKPAWSFEGLLVRAADEIAQRHHDLEDGLIAKIMTPQEVTDKLDGLFRAFLKPSSDDAKNFEAMCRHAKEEESAFVQYVSRFVVNFIETQLIQNAAAQIEGFRRRFDLRSPADFERIYTDVAYDDVRQVVDLSPELKAQDTQLHDFLRNRVLDSLLAQRMDGTGTFMIRRLVAAYLDNPQQLPDSSLASLMRTYRKRRRRINIDPPEAGRLRERVRELHNSPSATQFHVALLRTICDRISGMTDEFATREYQQLYGHEPLQSLSVI
jgi:dGTPase